MRSILLLCLAMSASIAQAQEAGESNTPAAPAKPNPFLIDKAITVSRCEQPALIKCLEMEVEACKTAMSEATDEANAAMAAEIAKAKPTTPAMEGFIQGLGSGRLLGGMIRRTNGKFYSCMSKR